MQGRVSSANGAKALRILTLNLLMPLLVPLDYRFYAFISVHEVLVADFEL
jgi:hypothetical protein